MQSIPLVRRGLAEGLVRPVRNVLVVGLMAERMLGYVSKCREPTPSPQSAAPGEERTTREVHIDSITYDDTMTEY